MKVSFENIEQFAVPLSEHPLKWMFEDENHQISPEFSDQIIPLNAEATEFLNDFELYQRIFKKEFFDEQYFILNESISIYKSEKEIKKWLFNSSIPFDKKVFCIIFENKYEVYSFVLTWKMVIKFSPTLFSQSAWITIWDESLNWGLIFNYIQDGLYFGKDRIFGVEEEYERLTEKQELLDEIKNKLKNTNNFHQVENTLKIHICHEKSKKSAHYQLFSYRIDEL